MGYCKNISLEKGMYAVPGKSFTQVLEELDSSENYRGTPLEGLDAYQRQLKRFAIKVNGPGSGTVEQFFQSGASAALFPEYVARAVRQGMEGAGKVQDLVAVVTKVDGMDYRTITTATEEPPALAPVEEGGQLPSTDIRASKGLVNLKKRGRMLVSSYEALRFQKLDLLTVALRQIGAYMAAAQLQDGVDVLLEGDGSMGGVAFTEGGTPNYADFIALWGKLAPFELNTVAAGTAVMQKLLQVPEFKDAQAGMNFQGTGRLCTPLGAKLIHVPGMAAGKLLVLDKNCALEMAQAGDITTDHDRLIDRQLERAAITVTYGFARIFQDAAAGLDCTGGNG
ncbi:phage major capsid protein [Acutalibacter caecimuris]|uniref:phage major capsid protein n=1 Tax=Acutalibacter caecimuris TaxID=3093657 RepID=UPI002AC90450|nr:phage major capsid protein [Acutalibacter sp. M00118]